MTNETDINIDNEKELIITSLKSLCQYHYLPFSTQILNSASEIIDDFLKVLLHGPNYQTKFGHEALANIPAIKAIVPGFHLLKDFENWRSEPIDNYEVLSKIEEKLLNEIFNIHENWIHEKLVNNRKPKPVRFSAKIIDILNNNNKDEKEKNGRIKVIIRTEEIVDSGNIEEDIKVVYSEEEKTIQYIIPLNLFKKLKKDLTNIEFQKNATVYTLSVKAKRKTDYPPIPSLKLSNVNSNEKLSTDFTQLAMDLYKPAIEHFLYLDSQTSLLYIFSNNTEDRDRDVGLGGMFILLKKGIADDINCPLCRTIINYFSRLTDSLSSRLINFYQIQEIKQHATRAAISQVMARNMSHNIGSHVLNNLTDGERLSKPENKIVKCKAYQTTPLPNEEENQIIHQLAIYNHYVKCRMDYLSDVTFGTPVMHTNKNAYKELFKELDRVRLVLDYISGLSDFKYKIIFSKNDIHITDETEGATDFPVALPNDLLGCQAFYNIVENVIRNTAKHNQNKDGITVFNINFNDIQKNTLPKGLKESEHQFYEIEIFDDIKICEVGTETIKYKSFKTEKEKELHRLFIEDHNKYSETNKINLVTPIKEIDWLVYSQNVKLNFSVLQDNKLRNSSLGLLEMEASAAYLRKLDITTIEENEYEVDYNTKIFNSKEKLNILKAINKNDCLGYRFFISKPTEILLVGDFTIDDMQLNTIANDGVLVKSEEKFKQELENGVVYNHQFVLYQKSNTVEQILKDRKTSISVRKLEINDMKDFIMNKITENYSFIELEDFIWQKWFDEIKGPVENINVFTSYHSSYNQANKYNIAFSNHNDTWEENKKDVSAGNVNYLESLSSIAQKKLPNYKDELAQYTFLPNGQITLQIKHKLFESAIKKVVVIDERIQRFSNTPYSSKNINVPIKDIFELTNVIVPVIDKINLGAKNFSPTIISDIEEFIEAEIGKCNFLLIHYSILERMYPNSKEEINTKLALWSTPENIRVVITSGRGKPHKLPSNKVCYVNLSPVLNVFTDARSKYSINYLLNAARK